MTELRQEKVQKIADDFPKTEVLGNDSGDALILSWGGTYGSCRSATERLQNDGKKVSHVHLRWLNPLPTDLGEILIRFKKVIIPELNMGQLLTVIRAKYLVDAQGYNSIKGKPFSSSEIFEVIKKHLED